MAMQQRDKLKEEIRRIEGVGDESHAKCAKFVKE